MTTLLAPIPDFHVPGWKLHFFCHEVQLIYSYCPSFDFSQVLSFSNYFYIPIFLHLEKAMAPHSSTLAWKIPWMEEPGRLQSMGSLSWILSNFTFTFHFQALEKEMATHSRVLAWRIPGMGEPGGLRSMELHRVGHDWSDLAAAAAAFLHYDTVHLCVLSHLSCPTVWILHIMTLLFVNWITGLETDEPHKTVY